MGSPSLGPRLPVRLAVAGLASSARIPEILVQVVPDVGVRVLQELVLTDDHREVEPGDVLGCRLERHHRPDVPDDRQATTVGGEVRLHDSSISIESAEDLGFPARHGHDQRPHPVDHSLDVIVPNHLPVRPDSAVDSNVRICWLAGHLCSPYSKVFETLHISFA